MFSTADNGDTAVPVVPVSQSERNQRCDNAAELMRSLSIDTLFLAGGPNLNSLPVTMGCRMIKSPLELARMQKANACTLTAVNQVLGQVYN